MPKGFDSVRKASQEVEARRGAGNTGQSALWFKLKAGDEATVRFLEQDDDIEWCWMHEIPVENRQWGRPTPCLDQDKEGLDCPGCEREMARKFQGYINIIWAEAPVFKRDENGRLIKDQLGDVVVLEKKPQVAIWSSGIRLFEELDEINANFKGLMSRPFRVKRKGDGINTKYSINPVDVDAGASDLSEQEVKIAQNKYDLAEYTTPKSYDEFLELLGEGGGRQDNGSETRRVNPFMKNR